VSQVDIFHFSAGIQGILAGDGWKLGPTLIGTKLAQIMIDRRLRPDILANHLGLVFIGLEQVSMTDAELPDTIWTPGVPYLDGVENPADVWSAIAHGASSSQDMKYSVISRNISVCMRAAGLQLKNVANQYYLQHKRALRGGIKPGMSFSNVALIELHLACHSLLAEMASVRDYIATIGAIRVGAPEKIDALNRLSDWTNKIVNAQAKSDPLVQRLLESSDKTSSDPWLYDLGEFRNTFLHKRSMATDDRTNRLTVNKLVGRFSGMTGVEMRMTSARDNLTREALEFFSELFAKLCDIALFAATCAKYNPKIHMIRSL
jgi:hypothetical protein